MTWRRTAGALPGVALVLALTLVMPGVARAHASPDHADPRVGSTVAPPLRRVRLWFDSDLDPAFSSIAVHGPEGTPVDDGGRHVARSDPKLLEVGVPELAPGTYRVTWSVVTRDGHRSSGDYTFTVRP